MSDDSHAAAEWTDLARTHFGAAQLGDARRTDRLVKTAARVLAHPAGTLPEKLPDWTDLNGLYRLAARPEVTHAAVVGPHCALTLARARATPGVVLMVHDTTELDFTTRRAVAAGLGQIGNGGGRGYLCHNTLAVRPDGEVLGLAAQVLRRRRDVPAGERGRERRAHPGRESRLWQAGCEAAGPAPKAAAAAAAAAAAGPTTWVDVCDRGADAWEFLAYERAAGQHHVVRAAQDRRLDGEDHVGSDRVHGTLFAYARDLPTLATRVVEVGASAKKGSAARAATVRVAAGPVALARPRRSSPGGGGGGGGPLEAWVVHVAEVGPVPAGATPVEWILLTDLPADTAAAAGERVDWYARRPVVEDYHKGLKHKGLKTGVGVERPQFESAARLEPVVGLPAVVAAVLLGLRHAARRPDADVTPAAAAGVPPLWEAVVAARVYRTPGRPITVGEFVVGVARLGGFLARKNDGPPGWLTLWRGWARLHDLAAGAGLAKARCV